MSEADDQSRDRKPYLNGAPNYDLIVIGAGASGLAAARSFHKYAPNATFALLEARGVVGGRTSPGDRGAGYVDGCHRRVRRVLADLDLDLYPVHDEGVCFLETMPGVVRTYRGVNVPKGMPFRSVIDFALILTSLEATARSLEDLDVANAQWADPHTDDNNSLADLDNYSVLDYVRSISKDEEATNCSKCLTPPVFGAEAKDISLLWFLFYCQSSGSLSRLLSVTNGSQNFKVNHKQGFEGMCRGMASDLPSNTIRFKSAVAFIVYDGSVVTAVTHDGDTYTARRCILALSPSLYQTISFDPPLPEPKMQLSRAFAGTSSYAKARLGYSNPWWRKNGWSGQFTFCVGGPASYFIDDVKPEHFGKGDFEKSDEDKNDDTGNGKDRYGLIAFVVSKDRATDWRALCSEEKRKEMLCNQLLGICNDSRAVTDCTSYWDWDWEFESAVKCVDGSVPLLGPGNLAHWREIRTNCWDDNLIFAGTETATVCCGYVEGAIQSGERAAHEALVSLGLPPSGYSEIEPRVHKEVPNIRSFFERLFFTRKITPAALERYKRESMNQKEDVS